MNTVPEMRRPFYCQEKGCWLVPLTHGKFSKIDAVDVEKVGKHTWHLHKSHANRRISHWSARNGKHTGETLHRFILGIFDGKIYVDHKNGDRLDNRRANLRVASNAQNQWNRIKNPRTKYKGVCWHVRSGKWQVRIRTNLSRKAIGLFDSELEAALAYDNAARVLHKEFGRYNFPHAGEQSAISYLATDSDGSGVAPSSSGVP